MPFRGVTPMMQQLACVKNIGISRIDYPLLTVTAATAYTGNQNGEEETCRVLSRRTFVEETLLALAQRAGVCTDDLVDGPSLLAANAAGPQHEIFARIIRETRAAMNDEMLGMTSRPVPFRTFDFAMKSALHCRTLSEFMLELIAAAELMYSPPDLGAFLQIGCGSAAIELRNAHCPDDELYFTQAFMSTHRGMSWLIDERLMLTRIELRAADTRYLEDLREIFQCEVQLARRRNAIVFDARYLNAPVRRSLEELNGYLQRRPLDVLYMPGVDRSISCSVVRLLREHLLHVHDLPCASFVAAQLGLSGHLLHRRLSSEGTTLQALKDRVRHELAAQKLLQSSLPIEQISGLLGFVETNSFYRAFKKWAGTTPQAYRSQHSQIG